MIAQLRTFRTQLRDRRAQLRIILLPNRANMLCVCGCVLEEVGFHIYIYIYHEQTRHRHEHGIFSADMFNKRMALFFVVVGGRPEDSNVLFGLTR
jgi:hypothetical protein